jgi:hypothetical protein
MPRDLSASASLQRWVGALAVFCLATIAILSGRPNFSNASRPVRGITNPVLAMEVVRNVSEVDAILSDSPSPDRETMRLKQYADFGFIVCYAALFVAMALLLAPQGRTIAILAAAFGLIAAIFDVIENLAILRVVDRSLNLTTQAALNAIRYPSLTKWALVALAMGLLGFLALKAGSTGLRIVGALNVVAGLLCACGLFDNVFLAWSGLPMLVGFLTLSILFFRPYYRRRRP